MSMVEVISDHSKQNLIVVPEKVLEMFNLKMLFLEGNLIENLPEDLFEKLKRLTWLDLRGNKLETIPTGIKNHEFLETLLLQNNAIETLPNEVGLVPNLKALQLSGNPIIYPNKEVLEKGVSSICSFLKQQYSHAEKQAAMENGDEETTEVEVVEQKRTKRSKKSKSKVSIKDILRKSAQQYDWSNGETGAPVIKVKSLSGLPAGDDSNENLTQKRSKDNLYGIRPTSANNTLTVKTSKPNLRSHSYLNIKKKAEDSAAEKQLHQIWLKRLKEILEDQEKILQQEKNLNSLNKWRRTKKMELPRCSRDVKLELPPYDTDPECKMLSRKDLAKKIDNMIKTNKSGSRHRPEAKASENDLQKLINDVVEQMKNMDYVTDESMSPRSKQGIVGEQIKKILDLHKTIASLQAKNDSL